MRKNIYNQVLVLVLAFFTFGCEEEQMPGHLEDNVMNPPVNLVYSETLTGFLDTIQTELPTWEGTTNVKFEIDTITTDAEDFNLQTFSKLVSIDNTTGIITLSDDTPINLVGDYYFGINVYYSGGLMTHDSAAIMKIVNLPFSISYEEQPTTFSYTHQGVMATPTITDLEELTIEGFELFPEVAGISIDEKGQIIKENNDTPAGEYTFEVVMTTDNGVKRFENIYSAQVLPLDIDLSYTSKDVDFNFIGELSSPTISTEENLDIADFTYSMTGTNGEAIEGLTIDQQTGVISKINFNTPSQEHVLTVTVHTPLGDKIFEEVMSITVGERPTLSYTGATQGGTNLTKATLSPWSGMSASINVDITKIGTDLEFSFLDDQFEGISINTTTGEITVAEDSNIPEGTYPVNISILVKDHNLNEVMTYENVFSIISSAEAGLIEEVMEDFEDTSDYATGTRFSSDINGFQNVLFGDKAFGSVPYWVAKVQKTHRGAQGTATPTAIPADQDYASTALVKSIDINSNVRQVAIAFDEMYGYNDNNVEFFERSLTYNYDQNIDDEFNESGWATLALTNGTTFSTTSGFNTGTFNNVEAALNADQVKVGKLNIMMRFDLYKDASAKLAWMVDNFVYKLYGKSDAIYE
ncbi:hypothetical protein [Flammeovirga sp. SubArs3]|uniref:hypothetical protein n=1 Tax=Flammeovirga sp. SubArs3 TaxID=2995316 RepID=UPI00248B24E6|nr:hypothetical protein [Flammeovirga sp. SubArs3]